MYQFEGSRHCSLKLGHSLLFVFFLFCSSYLRLKHDNEIIFLDNLWGQSCKCLFLLQHGLCLNYDDQSEVHNAMSPG